MHAELQHTIFSQVPTCYASRTVKRCIQLGIRLNDTFTLITSTLATSSQPDGRSVEIILLLTLQFPASQVPAGVYAWTGGDPTRWVVQLGSSSAGLDMCLDPARCELVVRDALAKSNATGHAGADAQRPTEREPGDGCAAGREQVAATKGCARF